MKGRDKIALERALAARAAFLRGMGVRPAQINIAPTPGEVAVWRAVSDAVLAIKGKEEERDEPGD